MFDPEETCWVQLVAGLLKPKTPGPIWERGLYPMDRPRLKKKEEILNLMSSCVCH